MIDDMPRRSILKGMAVAASGSVMAAIGLRDSIIVTATPKEIHQFGAAGGAAVPVIVQERTDVDDNVLGRPPEIVFVERNGGYFPIGVIQESRISREMEDISSNYDSFGRVIPGTITIEYRVIGSGPVQMHVGKR